MMAPERRPGITTPLVEHFLETGDLIEIERLADDLGATGDPAAIDPLIYRLGDGKIQSDADTEDAVCSALVRLGVMVQLGNLNYVFAADENLTSEAKAAVEKHKQLIPAKYRRQAS